jgi:hypothetical protein
VGRLLGNSYTIIRNVALPTLYQPIPWVLVGPAGIHVYYASNLKGVFRAREDTWTELDVRKRQYIPSRPNLIRRVILMKHSLQEYLAEKGLLFEYIEPVLFFAHPGIHIESLEPAVHVVQADGIERFITTQISGNPRLDSEDVEEIVELLTLSKGRTPESTARQEISLSTKENVGVGKLRMQPWQWLVIGVLIFLWFLIIIIGALLLLNS